MTSDPSLGAILDEALRASAACQPEPPPIVAWTDDEVAFHFNWLSARALAAEMSDHFGIDFETAWRGLGHVPNEMLDLLVSSAGWTALAHRVASDIGMPGFPLFLPMVH